jgi:hypothetical protein
VAALFLRRLPPPLIYTDYQLVIQSISNCGGAIYSVSTLTFSNKIKKTYSALLSGVSLLFVKSKQWLRKPNDFLFNYNNQNPDNNLK